MKKNILESPVLRFFAEVADLMLLNVFTILCSLPLFTMGAAFSALHAVLLKKVRGEDPTISKPFFRAFRNNFKQATLLWLPMLLILGALVVDYILFKDRGGVIGPLMSTVTIIVAILWQAMFLYVFPLQARFENSNRQTYKNAWLLALGVFPRTVAMVIISLVPLFLFYTVGDVILPFYLMLGVSLPAYLCAKLYSPVFLKLESADEGDGPGDP